MSIRSLMLAAFLAVPSVGTTEDASPLLGVWKVQQIAVTGSRPSTISNPQPGYWVFTPGFYSIVMINSATPRPKFEGPSEPDSPTPEQKAARYDQWSLFAAQAGSYKLQGTTVTASRTQSTPSRSRGCRGSGNHPHGARSGVPS